MVSVKVTVVAVTLITLCVLASNKHAAYVGCCRRHIRGKIRFEEIKGFSVQNNTEVCPISAIIFHTKRGKACANPALEWVMDYVSRIEYQAQKVHQRAQMKKQGS
ncbi:C-C motif chemokine 4 homolog [Cyprinodon tularosa]|uniref:C-C motif chemokine 4 homolog n=1 Tax=Cyprinodon tularosa TaxID=77115 RepID=UPI0018E20D91|nr:C-C motif chemokine 4 homolog [Cyprinodon tularosa]